MHFALALSPTNAQAGIALLLLVDLGLHEDCSDLVT